MTGRKRITFTGVSAELTGTGAGAVLFAALLLLVRVHWGPLQSLDTGVARDLNGLVADHPSVVAVLRVVTTLGSHGVLFWVLGLGALILLVRKLFRSAAYLVAAGLGSLVLDPVLKDLVGRLRPVVADPIARGQGNSFPSGHALGSIVGYGALLLVFLPAIPRKWRRPAIIAVAVLIVAIGASRVLLGVHYVSDVVGAWALGVAWLSLTAYAVELWRRSQGERSTEPMREGIEPEAAADLKLAEQPAQRFATVARLVAGAIVAWVLILGAVTGLGELVTHYAGRNLLGDTTIPHYLAAHRTATLNGVSFFWSEAGNTHAIMAVGLVAGAVALAVIRRLRPVIFLLALMAGELTLFLVSELIVGRPRPDIPQLDQHLPTSSYPSGHVAATTCLYAAIALLVMSRTRAWWRWFALVPAIAMPLLVASSRAYRGMHHPTDILGGLLIAALWLPALWLIIRPSQDLTDRSGPGGRSPERVAVPVRDRLTGSLNR